MFTRILVAIDGSETSQHAFEAALLLARENGAELQPLYVVDIPASTYSAPGIDLIGLDNAMREEGNAVTAAARAQMTPRSSYHRDDSTGSQPDSTDARNCDSCQEPRQQKTE